jgi:hypothetical protein
MKRPRLSRLATLALISLVMHGTPARAVCPGWSSYTPNAGYPLNKPETYSGIAVSKPFWTAFGAHATDPTHDYDVSVYSSSGGGPEPQCFSGFLAGSSLNAGKTDFIIGDFNHNPYATYYVWTHCYSGPCDNNPRGLIAWRDGDNLAPNANPITVDVNTYEERVLHVYDSYLIAGTKYFFYFTQTGSNEAKLLLFRNPGGGVYWAGRSQAEFEVSGCQTYTAPATGYYGVVVVQDRDYVGAQYTLGVSTTPQCYCPSRLISDVPQIETPQQTDGYHNFVATDIFWLAVGLRSTTADWDLLVGDPALPDSGCPITIDAQSSLTPPPYKADLIAGDFNAGPPPPKAKALRALHYNGSGGATIQFDNRSDIQYANGPKESMTLYGDDVVRMSDVFLQKDTTYTFDIGVFGADIKALVFSNQTVGTGWLGRAGAVHEIAARDTFTAPSSRYYGLVVVKDDEQTGGYSVSYGFCASPKSLTARVPYKVDVPFVETTPIPRYYTFTQPDTTWAAVGVYSPVDYDIRQYGTPSGGEWPDCFGAPGAWSQSSIDKDFLVGDFHHQPIGTQYIRAYQYTSGAPESAAVEWDPGRGNLIANDPAVSVGPFPAAIGADRLWCYQVYLYASVPYTFYFGPSGSADLHVLLFAHPTDGTYWAPRSAAVFSATGNQSYTPSVTGWHAVVVVNDNQQGGSFALRVGSTVLAVHDPPTASLTGIARIVPNPASGPLRIGFSIAEDAPVSFELIDLAGRLVARTEATRRTSGAGELVWDLESRGAGRTPAGMYFVRMRVGSRLAGAQRVVLTN